MNKLNYRKADIEDIDQIRALHVKAYGQFADVLSPDNWAKMLDNMEDLKSLRELMLKSFTYICEIDNKIVGAISLVPRGNPTDIFMKDWSYIRKLGVDPEYRGRGIAKKLVLECISEAIALRESRIALHTSEFMESAKALYENAGFKMVRELDPIFGKRYWLYKLDLYNLTT
ncbi:GNAT family N-acetyltransferase [Chitinophaga sp. CF118]|uniref:GNAT family N-acetyltransferase n=1 Tax=Chitinophaga sp. CF118 TaxID=1884367 RepID=UPI000B259DB5|nr:GNAT family N-acetyltransferase [Chitinophaga sp. CF118]